MFAHTPVHAAKTRQPNTGSFDWAAREAEAARNADQSLRPNPSRLRATPLPAYESANDNDLDAGAGQPLAPAHQEFFETQFGHDFSRVRVHSDAQAAQLADEASATAFTKGRHIVFGAGEFKPDTPSGAALLAHELTHVAQQGDANGAQGSATQCEPKPGKKGIGNTPPGESVIVATGAAPEDNSVLFEQDSASVLASEKKLSEIFGIYAVPVTIELHGYASREGDTEYNSNLSGHRAIALKEKALKFLPPGSKVVLYARGETEAFGAARNNRRVGVKLVLDAAPKETKDLPSTKTSPGTAKGRDAMTFDPTDPSMSKPTVPGGTGPISDTFTPPSPTVLPPFTLPPLSTPGLLDWPELLGPIRSRGVRVTDREMQAIEQNFWTTYWALRRLGLRPELAALGANKGTAFAYDNLLSREEPSVADQFEKDFDKDLSFTMPGHKKLGTIMFPLNPALEWLSKNVFKYDLKLRF